MFIAKKVCRFNGNDFLKGEVIPDELILKSKVPQLIKTGVITESNEESEGKGSVTIPITCEDGTAIEVELNTDDLIQVFDYLGKNAEDAKAIIDGVTSNDVLIVLDHTETRKGMKDYIKERALKLEQE